MGHPLRARLAEMQTVDVSESEGSPDFRTCPARRQLLIGLMTSSALVGGTGARAQTALPQGGTVVAGSAVIAADGAGHATITQSSARAIVNWDSFSVGQGNAVRFDQPDARAAILNRVTGSTTSQIAGTISGNGQVYLVNANGIAITATGSVNVGGGFVASALDIGDEDFLSGKLDFRRTGSAGLVSNAGTLSVGSGGFAALLGGRVANTGLISVPLGKIGLGGADAATLDFTGDGFLQLALPSSAAGSDPLVTAAGRLVGARVVVRASTLTNSVRAAVVVPGALSAQGAHREGGEIVIDGGEGSALVTGQLDAAALDATANGGRIGIGGGSIALEGAQLNAAGANGGTIAIGGGDQGRPVPGLTTASTLHVDAGTRVDASGTHDGGDVTLWSENDTLFAGRIIATGITGDGGNAEVSGRRKLAYDGFTDLRTRDGATGTLLLDPYDVTISTGTDTAGFTANANDTVINTTTLTNALGTANVTVSTGSSGTQAGNITVANAISWNANTRLTLDAAGAILLDAGITNSGATSGLTLTAAGTGGVSGAGAIATNGALTVNVNNAAATGTLSGIISGTGTLTKAGAGALTISGTNSYSGVTTISGGTFRVLNTSTSANVGTLGTGNVSIGSGAVLEFSNARLASDQYRVDNVISGAGRMVFSGPDGATTTLNAFNTYTGGTTIQSGIVNLFEGPNGGNTNVFGTGTVTMTGGAIRASNGGKIVPNAMVMSGTLGFGAQTWLSGPITLAGNTTVTPSVNFGGGASWYGSSLALGSFTLSTANNGPNSLGGTWSSTFSITAPISGTGGLTLGATMTAPGQLIVSGNNSYTGPTTVNAGNVQIGNGVRAALPSGTAVSIASGASLSLNLASSTISNTIANAGTLAFVQSGNVTTSGTISGTGAVSQTGTGTTTLSGANSYTGATTVSAGTLKAGSIAAFGNGSAVTVASGATMDLSGFNNSIGTLAGTGTATNNGANATLTFTNIGAGNFLVPSLLTDGTGVLSIHSTNSGRVTFTNQNGFTGSLTGNGQYGVWGSGSLNYGNFAGVIGTPFVHSSSANQTLSGYLNISIVKDTDSNSTLTLAGSGSPLITIDAGFLRLGSASPLGLSGVISFGGGTLQYSAANQTDYSNRFATTANQPVSVDTNGQNVTFATGLTSSGGTLTKLGAGTLTLSGANSYTGATTVSAGTLQIGNGTTGSLSASSAVSVASGATLALNRATGSTFANTIGVAGTVNFLQTGTLTASGVISGGGVVTQAGAGTTTLSGANTYTGGTVFGAGTLNVGSSGALGSTGTLLFGGGTLQYSASNATDYSSRFSSAGNQLWSIDTNSQDRTFASPLSGTGSSLTKIGLGRLQLTGTNSYTGNTTISAGGIQLASAGTLGAGSYAGNISGGGYLQVSTGVDQILSGTLSGGLALYKDGGSASTLTLSGTNTFNGLLDVTVGTVQANAAGSLGSGTIRFYGGTLKYGPGNTADYSSRFLNADNQSRKIDTNGQSVTFASALQGNGSSLTKNGAGKLSLSGANSYTGVTTINGGILQIGANGSTGTLGMGAVTNNAELWFRRIDASLTVPNSISGTGLVRNEDAGTVTLSGTNSYTGGTTVHQGTLRAGSTSAFGSNSDVNVGGTLDLAGFSNSIGTLQGVGTVTTNGGNATLTFTNANGGVYGVTTLLRDGTGGRLSIAVTSSGRLMFSRSNLFTGDLMGNGGLGSFGITGTGSFNGGTYGGSIGTSFFYESSANQILSGNLSGILIEKSVYPDSILTLAGNNGPLTANINAGVLRLGSALALGELSFVNFDGGTLQYGVPSQTYPAIFNPGNNQQVRIDTNGLNVTLASALTSTGGTLTKLGAGTLTLTGANTYTGATTISGGTLQIGAGGAAGSLGTGSVSNNGVLTFNRADDLTVANTISGTGSLIQAGLGTLTLSGTNTYTDATTVSSGMLQIGDGTSGSIAPGSAVRVDDLGVLALNLASGAILPNNIDADGVVSFIQGGALVASGNLTGLGTIQQWGSGTTTLTGTNTYAGGTGVFEGTLTLSGTWVPQFGSADTFVEAGAVLNGTGVVTAATLAHDGAGMLSLTGANRIDTFAAGQPVGSVTLNNAQGFSAGPISSSGDIALAAMSGSISITGAMTAAGGISLAAGDAITATGDIATVTGTSVTSGADSIVSGNISGAGGLFKAGTGTLTLSGANSFTGAASVTGGTLKLDGAWDLGAATATTFVASGAALYGSGVVTAGRLAHGGSGTVSLTGNNVIGQIGVAGTTGAFGLNNAQSLSVGSIQSSGHIALTTTPGSRASLTLEPGAALGSTAGGTAVTLAPDGNFINSAGANALSAPNGRWIVYLAAPGGNLATPGSNVFDGLDSGNHAVWNIASGATVVAAGNRYAFAVRPVVTFSPTGLNKQYGVDAATMVAGSYSVTGINTGVAGAYLADTAARAYSGTPVVTSPGAAAGAEVGTGPYAVSIAQGSITPLNGYDVAFGPPSLLTVTPAPLTIMGTTTATTYNGLLQANGFATSGLFGSDTVTGVTGLASGTHAGTYVDNLSGATGSGLSNYTIGYLNGRLTIDRAALTLTGANNGATYNGTAHTNTGAVLSGLQGSDSFTITGYASGTAAGTYADSLGLTATGGSLLSNYDLSVVQGGLTITPAPLTISGATRSTTYNGQVQSNGFATSGLFGSDTVTGVAGLASGTNAGIYVDNLSGATGSGLSNYTIDYLNGRLTIDRAALTLTGANNGATYNGTAQTNNGAVLEGVKGSDSFTITGYASGTSVGSYTDALGLTANGVSLLSNYALSISNGRLRIDPALLTITGTNTRTTYNGATFTNGFTTSGLFGSDTVTGVAGLASGTHAGTYVDNLSGATGSGLGNYAISYANGRLTIDRAPLTLTGVNIVASYDAQLRTNGGAVLSGVQGSDSFTITGYASGTAAGSYADSLGLTASGGSLLSNYDLSVVQGGLTITPAPLTISGATRSTTYNGQVQSNGFTTSSLFGSDTVTGVAGLASGTHAGTYVDNLSGATGSGLGNYAISYANGNLTIDRAPLTLTYVAEAARNVYGAAPGALTGTVSGSGFVGGEGLGDLADSALWHTTATARSETGSYAITGSGLASNNYAITSVQAAGNASAYRIDPAALTITANDAARRFDATAFTGGNGVRLSGLVNGDTLASLTGALTYGGSAQGAVNAGTYQITASGLASGNYAITYLPGKLLITSIDLQILPSLFRQQSVTPVQQGGSFEIDLSTLASRDTCGATTTANVERLPQSSCRAY